MNYFQFGWLIILNEILCHVSSSNFWDDIDGFSCQILSQRFLYISFLERIQHNGTICDEKRFWTSPTNWILIFCTRLIHFVFFKCVVTSVTCNSFLFRYHTPNQSTKSMHKSSGFVGNVSIVFCSTSLSSISSFNFSASDFLEFKYSARSPPIYLLPSLFDSGLVHRNYWIIHGTYWLVGPIT